jgi:hypothetical protein
VDFLDGREPEVLRRFDHTQLPVLDPLQDMVSTRGHLKARHKLAVDQFAAAVVQVVIV